MLAVVVALQTHYGISSFNWIKPEFSMIAMAGREEEAGPYHQSACLQRPAITAKGLPPPPPTPYHLPVLLHVVKALPKRCYYCCKRMNVKMVQTL